VSWPPSLKVGYLILNLSYFVFTHFVPLWLISRNLARVQAVPFLQQLLFALLVFRVRYTGVYRANLGALRRFKVADAFSAPLSIYNVNVFSLRDSLILALRCTGSTAYTVYMPFITLLYFYLVKAICLFILCPAITGNIITFDSDKPQLNHRTGQEYLPVHHIDRLLFLLSRYP